MKSNSNCDEILISTVSTNGYPTCVVHVLLGTANVIYFIYLLRGQKKVWPLRLKIGSFLHLEIILVLPIVFKINENT